MHKKFLQTSAVRLISVTYATLLYVSIFGSECLGMKLDVEPDDGNVKVASARVRVGVTSKPGWDSFWLIKQQHPEIGYNFTGKGNHTSVAYGGAVRPVDPLVNGVPQSIYYLCLSDLDDESSYVKVDVQMSVLNGPMIDLTETFFFKECISPSAPDRNLGHVLESARVLVVQNCDNRVAAKPKVRVSL